MPRVPEPPSPPLVQVPVEDFDCREDEHVASDCHEAADPPVLQRTPLHRTRLRRAPPTPTTDPKQGTGAVPQTNLEGAPPLEEAPFCGRTGCCLFGTAVGLAGGAAGGVWVGISVAKAEMAKKMTELLGPKLAGFFV
eukprot:Hpha_TRINITY_DN30193_c0_g1::TRINITY_DN30193_c0_g1_i1::g.110615::m.110615